MTNELSKSWECSMNVGRNDTLMETTMLVNGSINSPHVKISKFQD